MNRSKAKGTALESAVVLWFKMKGWLYAKRLTLKGTLDEGDVTLGDGFDVTIECKNTKAFTPAQFLSETLTEMENNGHDIGFAIIKKRGTTDVGQYYALTNVEVMAKLLRRAGYAPAQPKVRRKIRS